MKKVVVKSIENMLKDFLLVGLGGAAGSMMRYGITLLCSLLTWSSTMGTLLVNIVGSFIIGILMAACNRGSWYLLAAIGFCGGFTTFSTFSAQILELFQNGKTTTALVYVAATLLFCICFVWLGFLLGEKLMR